MKNVKFTSVLVLSATLLVAGCATNGQPIGALTQRKVSQLSIGTSQDAVVAALGRPSAKNSRITASGTQELWLYAKDDLIEHIEGGAAAFGYGFRHGLEGSPMGNITLGFTNGFLTSIEGL